jgi:hypothetical protein
MSIIVETGTASSTSETLCSVAYADTWHLNRGCAPWATLTTAQKEEALRRASDYFEQVYGQNFQGYRVNSTQALSWPRSSAFLNDYVVSSTTIPSLVINATAELAYKAAQGNLAVDLTQGVKREKVGVLEVEYDNYSVQYTRYRSIDNILAPLLTNLAGGAWKPVFRV